MMPLLRCLISAIKFKILKIKILSNLIFYRHSILGQPRYSFVYRAVQLSMVLNTKLNLSIT